MGRGRGELQFEETTFRQLNLYLRKEVLVTKV